MPGVGPPPRVDAYLGVLWWVWGGLTGSTTTTTGRNKMSTLTRCDGIVLFWTSDRLTEALGWCSGSWCLEVLEAQLGPGTECDSGSWTEVIWKDFFYSVVVSMDFIHGDWWSVIGWVFFFMFPGDGPGMDAIAKIRPVCSDLNAKS